MKPTDPPAIDASAANASSRHVKGDFEYVVRVDDPEQPSLFSPDEVIVPQRDVVVPERLKEFKKAVAAIHAIPIKGGERQTINVRRLFDALILFAQLDVRSRGPQFMERLRDPSAPATPMFEARVHELCRLGGISNKNYDRVYKDMDELLGMKMSWNIVSEDASVEFEMKANFLSMYGRGVGKMKGTVRFSIEASILQIVLDPANWATLSLQVMSGLTTSASYGLYQNAWRYINTAQKVTAALPTETWIELLMGPSRFVKVDAEGRKYVEDYGGFKQRHLNDAIERVNAVPALSHTIELKEHKAGLRVVRLQFKFVRKQQNRLEMPLTWPYEILQPLMGLGYSQEEISSLSEAHSFEVVKDSLLKFNEAKERLAASGKRITSHRRYFEGILDNIAKGADDSALDAEKLEARIRAEQAQQQAEDRRRRNEEKFQQHQKERFRDALFALPENVRLAALTQFEASDTYPKAKPLLEGRGWSPASAGALVILRQWMQKNRPDLLEDLLPDPQDRSLEAWLDWRAEQASN